MEIQGTELLTINGKNKGSMNLDNFDFSLPTLLNIKCCQKCLFCAIGHEIYKTQMLQIINSEFTLCDRHEKDLNEIVLRKDI
jgi:hypothetical protein